MSTLSLASSGFALTMIYAGGEVDYTTELVTDFVKALSLLDKHVSMEKLTFRLDGAGPAYMLRIKALDGRVWRQWHTFSSPTDEDPLTTFTVNDTWKPSEFQFHRPARDQIIMLYARLGVTSIEALWS